MNHKLKAAELINKFYKCMPFEDVKLTSCNENAELILEMEILSAGQCAIIAVDEILSLCEDLEMIEYWQEVKKELTI